MTATITYIATDLELDSGEDLSELVEEFGDRVNLHLNQWVEETYRVCLGLGFVDLDGDSEMELENTLTWYCSLVESLSEDSRKTWDASSRRVLDIAFESGMEPKCQTFEIPPELFRRISDLGMTIAVTIYRVGMYSEFETDA